GTAAEAQAGPSEPALEDRQGARPGRATHLAGERRRDDRMTAKLKRREFISLLGGAAAWPVLARGQEAGRIYRLGCLFASPRDAPHYVALFDELRRLGFIEGQNLLIDTVGFSSSSERMEVHAADLVKAGVDVILVAAIQ